MGNSKDEVILYMKLQADLRKLVEEIELSGTRYDDHIHYKEWSTGLVLKRIKNLLNGGE